MADAAVDLLHAPLVVNGLWEGIEMTAVAIQLATLQDLRSKAMDVQQISVLDELIANLESGESRSHEQQIIDSEIFLAVSGDINGNVYLSVQHSESKAKLLEKYLKQKLKQWVELSFDTMLPGNLAHVPQIIWDTALANTIVKPISSIEPSMSLNLAYTPLYITTAPYNVIEAIAFNRCMVLLGSPGSGKTTILHYVALNLARASLDQEFDPSSRLHGWNVLGEEQRLFPILVPLPVISKKIRARAARRPTADDLLNYFTRELDSDEPGLAIAMTEELQAGRALLLLDGLDEISDLEMRRQISQAIQVLAVKRQDLRIIITCRTRDYDKAIDQGWNLQNWSESTLAALTLNQQLECITKWQGALAEANRKFVDWRVDRLATLKQIISRYSDLQRLCERPLLLFALFLWHLDKDGLGEHRADFYNYCIDLLLDKWEKARDYESDYGSLMTYMDMPDINPKDLRYLLAQVIFDAFQTITDAQPGQIIKVSSIKIMHNLNALNHPSPYHGALRLLKYLDARAGIFRLSDEDDGSTFEIPMDTLQSYLAGLKLVSYVNPIPQIRRLYFYNHWRGPILLGIGHLIYIGAIAIPYQLLSEQLRLYAQQEEDSNKALQLVVDIGDDVGWEHLASIDQSFTHIQHDLTVALERSDDKQP